MRARSRVAAGRGVVAALALLLSATGLLVTGSRPATPDTVRASGYHARTDAVLALTRAPGSSPRVTTDRYVARQAVAGAGASSTCSGGLFGKVVASTHFCVHYSSSTTDAQAQLTSDTLEHVYATEVGTLGFRPPVDDGDGRLDVTLTELGNQGIYGYCTTTTSAAQSPAYCELDNDFSQAEYGAPADNSLRVTAAHEFFHAIQFAYNTGESVWAMEGTAVWAEDEVYPTINDYVQYLPYSAIREPGKPVDSGGPFERYGAVVFWKFLSEYLADPGVIRQIWQYADATGQDRTALPAVVEALAAHRKAFGPTFARFASWNTLPPGSYTDRLLYPAPVWALATTLRRADPGTGPRTVALDHLSSSAYLVRPGRRLPRGTRLRVTVTGPSRSTMPQALVQLRMSSGAVRYLTVPLNAAGDGSLLVPFDPRLVRAAVVTLSNASLAGADGQRFVLRARLVL